VHGFVEAQAFDVRQRIRRLCPAASGEDRNNFRRDEARLRRRLDELCEGAEGKTNPGNDNGPTLDAAMAVDAFFERSELEDFVHREVTRFRDFRR